jgi:hypothetical protein
MALKQDICHNTQKKRQKQLKGWFSRVISSFEQTKFLKTSDSLNLAFFLYKKSCFWLYTLAYRNIFTHSSTLP